MPADDDYALTLVAEYLLPINSATSMDIAPGSTLLWMVASNQVTSCFAIAAVAGLMQ